MKFEMIFTPWRLKWYSIVILTGLFLSLFIVLFTGRDSKIISGRLGGDFASFYGAGRTVLEGRVDSLYKIDEQKKQQKDLFPDSSGFLPFPYPPFVAIVCAPLAKVPYRAAYLISLSFNIFAFFMGFLCIRELIPGLKEYELPAFTISLTWYPFFKAVFLGQNSAITFMLIALTWLFVSEDKQFLAGFFLGLLVYKPQFAVPLIGLFLLSGRAKVVVSALITGGLIFSVGLMITGIQGYHNWYDYLKWFPNADAIHNKHNSVSWMGFLDAIFSPESRFSQIFGLTFCLLTILTVSCVWFVGGKGSDFSAQMSLGVVSLILMQPHAMFYDAGVILLPYALILNKMRGRRYEFIIAIWISSLTQIFAHRLGFSPIFLIVVITYVYALFLFIGPATEKMSQSNKTNLCAQVTD